MPKSSPASGEGTQKLELMDSLAGKRNNFYSLLDVIPLSSKQPKVSKALGTQEADSKVVGSFKSGGTLPVGDFT